MRLRLQELNLLCSAELHFRFRCYRTPDIANLDLASWSLGLQTKPAVPERIRRSEVASASM